MERRRRVFQKTSNWPKDINRHRVMDERTEVDSIQTCDRVPVETASLVPGFAGLGVTRTARGRYRPGSRGSGAYPGAAKGNTSGWRLPVKRTTSRASVPFVRAAASRRRINRLSVAAQNDQETPRTAPHRRPTAIRAAACGAG